MRAHSNAAFGPFAKIFGPGTPYLSLLNLGGDKTPAVCGQIVVIVESTDDHLTFLSNMLDDANWRPHLVSAVAALVAPHKSELVSDLWTAFDSGSWVSPQLAVALLNADPDFPAAARARITAICPVDPPAGLSGPERHSATGPAGTAARSAKNVATLLELLSSVDGEADRARTLAERDDVREILALDTDHAGHIVRSWAARARTQLGALGYTGLAGPTDAT